MLILELAVQAVRGFSPSARVPFRPGYLGLSSPTEIPAPVGGLLLALAYPDGRGGESSFLAPGAPAGRAGFSVQSNDGTVWRLVRDLGGAGALHKMNQSGGYEVATDDTTEMAQLLRSEVGFPARPTLEQVFVFTAGQLPTRRSRAPKGAGTTGTTRAFVPGGLGGGSVAPTSDPEGTRAKIAQLEAELAQAKEVGEVQFKADGIQSEIYQQEQKLKAVEALRAEVAQARAELDTAPSPAQLGLPDDIADRVKRFSDTKKKFHESLAKLETEREQAGAAGKVHVESIGKDNRFIGALVGGLAMMIAAVMLTGSAKYVGLLGIPAFSFAALLALRYIEELQFASREGAKVEIFEQREKKLKDDFQLQSSIVDAALSKVNATTDEEFFSALARREEMEPKVAELTMKLAELESDPATTNLATTVAELREEYQRLDERLASMSGGYARDAREIEREIGYLKESLAPAQAPGQFQAINPGGGQGFDDPTPGLMIVGADLFATDIPSLWGVMRDRTIQYLTALTDRRYHGVEVDKDGRAFVMAPGRDLPATELPGRDLDLLYLSLRLTMAEKSAPTTRYPVILEDSFASTLGPEKQPLLGRMLKHIGSMTQVLHVTGAGQNAPAAEAVVQL